jgi:hypothetical protein
MSDIIITVIEDPSDILTTARARERLFSGLKAYLNEKGLVASIDVNESTGEESSSSEPAV